MREVPSQLPNLKIYDAASSNPRHFIEKLDTYAGQLQVPVSDLLVAAKKDGDFERSIKGIPLPPEVAYKIFRGIVRLNGEIAKEYLRLFPPKN